MSTGSYQPAPLTDYRVLLAELYALVCGEAPSLLNEDSGGDARLDMAIESALAANPAPAPVPVVERLPEEGAPSDEELDIIWDEEAVYYNLYSEARRFARAVLARYGAQPAPVPVAEAQP